MSELLTILRLNDEQRLQPSPALSRLKTVHEWAAAALDAVKDNADFAAALKAASPWAEAAFSAAKDTIPPVKFVLKVFEELTKVQEPRALARLACTLAYERAAEEALSAADPRLQMTAKGGALPPAEEDVDFENFTLETAVSHVFVQRADRTMRGLLGMAGLSDVVVEKTVGQIHDRYPSVLEELIANGKTKEKFDPLWRWLQLDSAGRAARAALRRHAEYLSWLYAEAPVLKQPFALKHIYTEAQCSRLTHSQLREKPADVSKRRNPFMEGEYHGGRHSLIDSVLGYLADPAFKRDAIVIQGTAGSGKSTFTLRLADRLMEEGFHPIRIRLRDVPIPGELFSVLSKGILLQDGEFLATHDRWPSVEDLLQGGRLFEEERPFGTARAKLCPYVLILDGWDEISVAISEGFKQRVHELLVSIRQQLLGPYLPRVGVILTGRPSDAVDDCESFFLDRTPVLTVRTLHPDDLRAMAQRIGTALDAKPIDAPDLQIWSMPPASELNAVFEAYEKDFAASQKPMQQAFEPDQTHASGASTVLGMPLLAQLALRMLADWKGDKLDLVRDPTLLLRRLTDYTVFHADRPSDQLEDVKVKARFRRDELRTLLRRTAAAMTAYGLDSIPRNELKKRLQIEDLESRLREMGKEGVLTGLMVSFYFRGGSPELGCEFTHKSFREYLFAEEIVEHLKAYGRLDDTPSAQRSPYWKEFAEGDPRRKATHALARLIAAQWLTPEVVAHLQQLLEWEIRRAFQGPDPSSEMSTAPISKEQWMRVRDWLADAWDWWGEGVHLRPQPRIDEDSQQVNWDRSLAERFVPQCRPLDIPPGTVPEPIRTTTIDAHLGDALFRLNAWVHGLLIRNEFPEWAPKREDSLLPTSRTRPYQTRASAGPVLFRPSGDGTSYFRSYCSRINGAGWRPGDDFPCRMYMEYVDLSQANLLQTNLWRADLRRSVLHGATLLLGILGDANLSEADLTRVEAGYVYAGRASFRWADVRRSSFIGAHLNDADFRQADIEGANFDDADWSDARFDEGNEPEMLEAPHMRAKRQLVERRSGSTAVSEGT
ncbi:conserved hypothetical protein [Candidatus Sulfopaludibacter sp. SbA6]|nr:conserved hypothetical protein [Candidatus Sulfopaludibacter sp. SbA6]